MKEYKVLWIDDDFNKDFDRLAYQNGIELVHYKTSKEGMAILESGMKTNYFDAVILDGLAYNESENEEHSIDGLINSLNKISELRQLKWFPVFVFTGELNKLEYKGDIKWVERFNVPIVIKGVDNKGFIEKVIAAADQQEITQLKHKYPNQFEICTNKYIGANHFERMIGLIKDIENPEKIKLAQDMLNPIRKIMEAILDKLNEIGLIPDEIRHVHGGISGSSYFLSGQNTSYEYYSELIHPMVAENIYRILNITQDGSHDNGKKLRADEYLSLSKNHNLYKSTIYLLLDIVDYMKEFIDDNSNIERNKAKWELKKEEEFLHKGIIAQDDNGNYFCDKYLLNKGYVERNNKIGDKIIIIESSENGVALLKELYPFFASKYKVS
ncbi:hypothetical protein DFR65_101112 [Oceanihabitans sediminis]|uniref:Uncharacterized protein n=1 Tax=Oceanihabitans sediminis TaxID=1812012 RepID=A0A368P7Z1_9FLAO|nr:hypothetical protein [Oceanihabitans sediminis]RBP34229.1 hypothetical protein DFR65_101112 [Oceanihabitans sediminis]RCU57919.1 hypothetical protein DU428_00555 [Oceanihabitans sediminis]